MLISKVTDLLSFIVRVYSILKMSIASCVVPDSLPDPEWEFRFEIVFQYMKSFNNY